MGTEPTSDRKLLDLGIVWIVAAFGGALVCVLIYSLADIGISGSLFLAGILTLIVGLFLSKTMLGPMPGPMSSATMASVSAPAPVMAPKPSPPIPSVVAALPEPEPEPEPTPEPRPVEAAVEADQKPQGLDVARAGGPDDLKAIKGVGPKLEGLLHSMGYYHFDQIAAWTETEVSWVDDNLEGFKGRVTRDAWVAQARELAKS